MPSTNSEKNNYTNYSERGTGIVGLTRAVVVSNLDPLFAGRVKVWIPVIHGFIGTDENPDETGTLGGKNFVEKEIDDTWVLHEKNIDMLPWAKVLSPGWAQSGWPGTEKYFNPTDIKINKKTVTNIQKPYGIYNMPKPGTEVFIMFEQNDPEFPVVVGSYHHKLENRYLPEFPIESFANHEAFKISTDKLENQYNNPDKYYQIKENAEEHHVNSSDTYLIKSERGAEFIICEVPDKEHMLFRSWMFPRFQNPDPVKKKVYEAFTSAYPNFPTTATAGLFKTKPLFIHDPSEAIEKTILKAAEANTATNSSGTKPPPDLPKKEALKAVEGGFTRGWPVSDPNVYNKMGKMAQFKGPGRAAGPHNGIDLPVIPKTSILAPIDGKIIGINNPVPEGQRSGSTLVGTTVILEGVDGMTHEFKHLDTWSVSIGDTVKVGQKIAGSGADRRPRTGSAAQLGIDRGHLHWDVFQSNKKTNIWSNTLVKGSVIFVDPKEWLVGNTGDKIASSGTKTIETNGGNGPQVTILEDSVIMTQRQLKQFLGTATSEKEESGRTMGLEMVLIEGEETIKLRHTSGSYIEIDVDGNINFFSVGDFNFRGNRSFNLDVWGGILMNAGAIYLKAKTVIKKISLREIREKLPGYGSLPRFFKRCDDMRMADMKAIPYEPIISSIGGTSSTDSSGKANAPGTSSNSSNAPTNPEKPSPATCGAEIPISVAAIVKAYGASNSSVSLAWPLIVAALKAQGIDSLNTEIAAAACIQTEVGSKWLPIKEGRANPNGSAGQKAVWKAQEKYWPSGFYGRGYIQITWKRNYEAAGKALGIDFVGQPDLVMTPGSAAKIVAWYFKVNKVNVYANNGDWAHARMLVNGGNGIDKNLPGGKTFGVTEYINNVNKLKNAIKCP